MQRFTPLGFTGVQALEGNCMYHATGNDDVTISILQKYFEGQVKMYGVSGLGPSTGGKYFKKKKNRGAKSKIISFFYKKHI